MELQPTDADAKLGLAKTLIAMKQTDKALNLLEETVQLDPQRDGALSFGNALPSAWTHRRCQGRDRALERNIKI